MQGKSTMLSPTTSKRSLDKYLVALEVTKCLRYFGTCNSTHLSMENLSASFTLITLENHQSCVDGRGNSLMSATLIFQKHCFFKKCPKNLTNFGKFEIFFLHFLMQFYRAFQWYIIWFHTLIGLGCTDQNVNQEIGGHLPFFGRLYV